ncbi:YEATS family protein [Spironucleus salmonicida]|uniref:YEATS family protein n=1 Tax=Spironucleus salmonicida TaxID=348837 RepID=V6LS65_9EUKA|nr:YEATS family protein [Spironucleus salmonicida]|eukprot:EST47502.1 YEATS family protein [Spironucleus salmonicida]
MSEFVDKIIIKGIQYGFVRKELKKTDDGDLWHYWSLFFQSSQNLELSHFIKKVTFIIDPSFSKPQRSILDPPYEISVFGVSSFTAFIHVYFTDDTVAPQFFPVFIEIKPDQPYSRLLKNDLLVFARPRQAFYTQLCKIEPQQRLSGLKHHLNPEQYRQWPKNDTEYTGTERSIAVYKIDEILKVVERSNTNAKEERQIVESIIDDERRSH